MRNLILGLAVLFSSWAKAEYRIGGYLGIGGTGIETESEIEGGNYAINRADEPGMFGLSIEWLTGNRSSFSLDHERGIQLAPFSSGVGFTGVTWRWFFGADESSVAESKDATTLIIAKRVPYFGLSTGIAEGTIIRSGDADPSIHASGVYFGIRAGYDFQLAPGGFFRTEIVTSGTTAGKTDQSKLVEFALQTGFVWIL